MQPRIVSAKIADFGTSRQRFDDEETANLTGTLCYMAPEVGANLLDRNEYGPSADIWSIGVVLYNAISGKLPFDEGAQCKLFLNAIVQNYDGFVSPVLKVTCCSTTSKLPGLPPQTPLERGLGRSPTGSGVEPQLHFCGETAGVWGGAPARVWGRSPQLLSCG